MPFSTKKTSSFEIRSFEHEFAIDELSEGLSFEQTTPSQFLSIEVIRKSHLSLGSSSQLHFIVWPQNKLTSSSVIRIHLPNDQATLNSNSPLNSCFRGSTLQPDNDLQCVIQNSNTIDVLNYCHQGCQEPYEFSLSESLVRNPQFKPFNTPTSSFKLHSFYTEDGNQYDIDKTLSGITASPALEANSLVIGPYFSRSSYFTGEITSLSFKVKPKSEERMSGNYLHLLFSDLYFLISPFYTVKVLLNE